MQSSGAETRQARRRKVGGNLPASAGRALQSYGYYIDGVSDKLLPNGQPDGREDKVEEKLDPKTCA